MFTKIDEGVVFSDVVAISSDVCFIALTINSVIDSVTAALGYFFDLLYGLRAILLKTIFDGRDDIFHY
jgi:hypothetical protein